MVGTHFSVQTAPDGTAATPGLGTTGGRALGCGMESEQALWPEAMPNHHRTTQSYLRCQTRPNRGPARKHSRLVTCGPRGRCVSPCHPRTWPCRPEARRGGAPPPGTYFPEPLTPMTTTSTMARPAGTGTGTGIWGRDWDLERPPLSRRPAPASSRAAPRWGGAARSRPRAGGPARPGPARHGPPGAARCS